jgi:hypothetical protein
MSEQKPDIFGLPENGEVDLLVIYHLLGRRKKFQLKYFVFAMGNDRRF